MLFLVLCFLFFQFQHVFGGSPCPPRTQIYPCICIDRSIGKSKFDTTVICHGLANGDSFTAIESGLSSMEINRFLLYDSYWQTSDTRRQQADLRIPVNHVSRFRMEEVEIVDTVMSVLGCPADDNCQTSYLKKLTSINSTVSDKTDCNNNGITITSWITCPANVQHVIINKGLPSDMTLKPEFFPVPMSKLKTLRLSHNSIGRIDKRTFTTAKFPVLQTLDLSYNSLRDVKTLFLYPLKLQYLDMSYNALRNLMDLQNLPHLHTLKLSGTQIMSLLEYEWQHAPSSLRHIDLSNNNIQCNCAIQWVNSTFHINTVIMGACSSPPEVASKKLRKAARIFIERCDKEGNLGPKKSKKS